MKSINHLIESSRSGWVSWVGKRGSHGEGRREVPHGVGREGARRRGGGRGHPVGRIGNIPITMVGRSIMSSPATTGSPGPEH